MRFCPGYATIVYMYSKIIPIRFNNILPGMLQYDFVGRYGAGVHFKHDGTHKIHSDSIRFNKILPGHVTIVQMSSQIQ